MVSFVTNTGIAEFVEQLVAADLMKYVGWGTGSAQTVASTDLATPAAEARTSGADTQQTTNTTGDTFRVIATLIALATRAITEVGIFDALSAGQMGVYGDFAVLNLATDDSITFTIDVVLDQA
jgi:hypothetical protein